MSVVLDTKKSNFENQACLRFHIWFVMSLHYKMRQRFYYKMQQSLLQNSSSVLLQNVKVLLQNLSVITKCIDLDATLKSLFLSNAGKTENLHGIRI